MNDPLKKFREIVADNEMSDERFVTIDCEDFLDAFDAGPDEDEFLVKLWNACEESPNQRVHPCAGDLRKAIEAYDRHVKSPGVTTAPGKDSPGKDADKPKGK